jgi:hypothetical protein
MKTMAKRKASSGGGSVPCQPKGGKRATVRAVAAGGIVAELRRAIAKAEGRGVSRYRIAKDAGVAKTTVNRFADGGAMLRLDVAERVAKAAGMMLTLVA